MKLVFEFDTTLRQSIPPSGVVKDVTVSFETAPYVLTATTEHV